jgi:hypothetical protein
MDLSVCLVENQILADMNKELGKNTEDYWKPAQSAASSIWNSIIKPNSTFFILLTILVLYLLYRYRYVKNKKINEEPEEQKVGTEPKYIPADLSEAIADDLAYQINHEPVVVSSNTRGYPQYILNPYQSKYINPR